MYTRVNYKTRDAFKAAVTRGDKILVDMDLFSKLPESTEVISVEGPHYPMPLSWRARVIIDSSCYVVGVLHSRNITQGV